jgi:ABC-type dipeptide/oligopeptide/nickel transport system permease component
MRAFLVRRLAATFVSLVGVTLVVTLFLRAIPGDPVDVMLGEQAAEVDRDALRAALGLDLPAHQQVFVFVRDLLTGELKSSLPGSDLRVVPLIAEKFPKTLLLAVVAMLLAVAMAIPLGMASARNRGKAIDQGAMVFSLLGISIPQAWLGPVLILVFAINLGWLPALGGEGVKAIVLPALTLSLAMMAMLSRMTRSSVLDVDREDFVTTARAKGLHERRVVWRHILRNALIPVITIAGLQFGALLAGAIVTEKIFNWPGMGTLLLESIQSRDYNMVRACVLVFTVLYVFVNLLVDVAYGIVDPRIRLGGEARR